MSVHGISFGSYSLYTTVADPGFHDNDTFLHVISYYEDLINLEVNCGIMSNSALVAVQRGGDNCLCTSPTNLCSEHYAIFAVDS